MRKDLYQLERIERFLEGSLTTSEKVIFENNLESDRTLKANLHAMEILQTASRRQALRQKIEELEGRTGAANPGMTLGLIILLALTIAALVFWSNTSSEPYIDTPKHTTKSQQAISSDSIFTKTNEIPVKTAEIKAGQNQPKLKTWVTPNIQEFSFDSEKGAMIEGRQGISVVVPEDAFIDESGKVVTGRVDFQLVEALGIEEMVLYGLKTVSTEGPLASGGMFYINANIDGKAVQINPSRPLLIEVPNPKLEEGMMAFEGTITEEGELFWENPRPLKKPLIPLPLEQLDFLPRGFSDQVHRMMPMFGYRRSSVQLVDSLYYSLNWDTKEFSPRKIISDTIGISQDSLITESTVGGCGIRPSSIEAIKTKRFENSFIATKDFERRLAEMHQLDNGQDLLDLYLSNLDKDLYISDSICNIMLGEEEGVFQNFYLEKAANVENAALYSNQLKQNYISESKKLRKRRLALYDEKLKELKEDANADIAISNADVAALTPSPAYALQWYSTGWGNIDRYFKELSRGSEYVNINVEKVGGDLSVTAWLPKINTYTDLNEEKGQFRAFYPSNYNRPVHVFALAASDDQYYWGFEKFKSSEKSEINLKPRQENIEQIKTDLSQIGESWGRLKRERTRIDDERARMQQQIRNFSGKYNLSNSTIRQEEKYKKLICKLKSVAFTCDCSQEEEQNEPIDEQIFTITEEMPSFPGGENELIQFLAENLSFPLQARQNNIEGTVYVSFVVKADGNIRNPRVIRGIGYGCDFEALEAVRKMPRWISGRQRNEEVDVQYTLPISFSLK